MRRFLTLVKGRLMSAGRLRMRLVYGLEVLLVRLPDYQLLIDEVHLVLGHWLGLCRSQSIGLHSQYIHSFSIIGVL